MNKAFKMDMTTELLSDRLFDGTSLEGSKIFRVEFDPDRFVITIYYVDDSAEICRHEAAPTPIRLMEEV
jgi:hypothetical protein